MKPAFVIWLIAAPTLAGVLITVVLNVPFLAAAAGSWILTATAASAIVAVPFSLMVGKALQ